MHLTPHAAALLMEGAAMQAGASSQTGLLQVLAAPTSRGCDAALGREGCMVWGRAPSGPQVLLGQPDVAERLAAGATHGRREGHRALQGAVLLATTTTRWDCGTTTGQVRYSGHTYNYTQKHMMSFCFKLQQNSSVHLSFVFVTLQYQRHYTYYSEPNV